MPLQLLLLCLPELERYRSPFLGIAIGYEDHSIYHFRNEEGDGIVGL